MGFKWPVRLGVRTQDFHSCNTGSIPVRATLLHAGTYFFHSLLLCKILLIPRWPVRLGVRTQDFHSCNTGSIPVRAARRERPTRGALLFSSQSAQILCGFQFSPHSVLPIGCTNFSVHRIEERHPFLVFDRLDPACCASK